MEVQGERGERVSTYTDKQKEGVKVREREREREIDRDRELGARQRQCDRYLRIYEFLWLCKF